MLPIFKMTKEQYEAAIDAKGYLTTHEKIEFQHGYYEELIRNPESWAKRDCKVLSELFMSFNYWDEANRLERSILTLKLNENVFSENPPEELSDAVIEVTHTTN